MDHFLPSLSRVRPFLNLYYFALVYIHMYAIHTVRQHQKKFQILFFFVFIETLYIHAREGVFFLFESSRYDYRWNCNFILTLERKAHKKDNMNKFQFCKPIELDDVVRFMLLPPTKITVTQYSHFFSSKRFKHKSNLSQNDFFFFSFLFSFFFLRVCVYLYTGALFGGLLGGFFLQYGRRRLLTLMSLPFSLSWILTVFAKSVETMFATAFIGGFCCSIVSMVTQV